MIGSLLVWSSLVSILVLLWMMYLPSPIFLWKAWRASKKINGRDQQEDAMAQAYLAELEFFGENCEDEKPVSEKTKALRKLAKKYQGKFN